jgi:hypothetical protein
MAKDQEILAELCKLNVALASIAGSLAKLANPRYRIGADGSVRIVADAKEGEG